VSSFTSVSLDPPLILVCLNRGRHSGRRITETGEFAVNVLQGRQRESAQAFAGSPHRFEAREWSVTKTGVPVLKHSLAVIECAVVKVFEAGDHDIIVGSVMEACSQQSGLEPLVYYRGQYRSLS
jgi:flavin reductase (DIM6/NTAB) family NADH-FMN oxidoreductase RutF